MATDRFQGSTGNECHRGSGISWGKVRLHEGLQVGRLVHCTWFVRSIAIFAHESGELVKN